MSLDESVSQLLSDALVFEYLKNRGLARTAEVYALETRHRNPALAKEDALSSQLWLNFRQKLGVNEALRRQRDAAAKEGLTVATPSTFEFILKKTIRGFNGDGGGDVDGRAAGNEDASADPVVAEAISAGPKQLRQKKKKRKPKARKFQQAPYARNPDINHNVQFHKLGKPVFRRLQLKKNDGSHEFATTSKESWMPMELRLKMLKRDIMLAKQKQSDVNDWEYRKQKKAYKTDEHARLKNKQELTQRSSLSRRMCALCEHDFLQLPFGVSYKAIMDLRRVWGVKVVPESRYLKFTLVPHCYETVRVCVFCSQFFGLDFFDSDRQQAVGVGT